MLFNPVKLGELPAAYPETPTEAPPLDPSRNPQAGLVELRARGVPKLHLRFHYVGTTRKCLVTCREE